ncbi:glucose-6-phosphate dehydrogenase [Candidatus Bipolaricaulota bacterium]|nr:glucose-6-phosphate dehydrogenase [Candidatus Bipolaricaulota bacterium]
MSEERVTFVMLGGTGDLARTKLVPSLFKLYREGEIGEFDLIGTSRKDLSREEYINRVGTSIDKGKDWEGFRRNIRFSRLDFYSPEDYEELRKKLSSCGNHRLFYLATLPQHFDVITDNLAEQDLVNDSSKVLYEKPFGDDLESAQGLNKCISDLFPEEKIYRIDHYLDKELVGNLSVLRFSNSIIDPLLTSGSVNHVQIVASENFGVLDRGEFYDRYGAVKDFFQSHLLQLLSLVGMAHPESLDAKSIRDEKVRVLKQVEIQDSMVGQYRGYREEEGVDDDSQTETLVTVRANINNERWQDVPFYLLSSKNLVRKYAQVYVQFDHSHVGYPSGDGDLVPNSLVVDIQPNQGIYFTINTKVPGRMNTEPARMEFCHSCHHGPNTPSAYENLLAQAIAGDQRSFVRYDEIEEQWRIVERMDNPEPFRYDIGEVPTEVEDFISHGSWHELEGEGS